MLLMSTETPLSLIVWFIWRSWGPCLKVQALVKVVLRSTSKFGRLEHWCIVHFDHIQRSHILEQCSSSIILRQELVDCDPKDHSFCWPTNHCKGQRNAITRKKTLFLRKAYINVFLASIIVRETQTQPCYFFKLSVLILSLYPRNPLFFCKLIW